MSRIRFHLTPVVFTAVMSLGDMSRFQYYSKCSIEYKYYESNQYQGIGQEWCDRFNI
jgi:hypothetical protein